MKNLRASAPRRLKKYPTYKDSGIEWLGEIPRDWKAIKIKRLCLVKRGASPRPIDDSKYFDEEGEYAWVRIADVTASERYLEITTQKLSELGKSLSVPLQPGELFLSIAGSVGKPVITKIKCCIHDGFVYFFGFKQNQEFLYYIFASGQPYLGLGKLGTQLNLNTDTVGDIKIGLPGIDGQNKIASFLDRKTAEIDSLIEKKRRMTELLQEKRTAVISHAVTKGLDPNAPMKDSGVEWLGQVPRHWEVKKLKYVVSKVGSGITPSGGANVYQGEGIPLLRSQNIYDDGLILDDIVFISDDIDEQMANSRIQDEDVLLNITGASIGRCFYVHKGFGRGNVNQHVCIIRPTQHLLRTRFLHAVIISNYGRTLIDVCQTGANREGLNFQQIKNFDLPLPGINEQEQIIDFVCYQIARIDGLISKIEAAIDKLLEYRTALISAAVTGKIDVRDEVRT